MTIIAYRDGILAADSVGWTAESNVRASVVPKIKRLRDGGLYGAAGDSLEINEFSEWMQRNRRGEKPVFDSGKDFISLWLKPDESLHMCGHKLNFMPLVDQFFAVGAAAIFCFGALHAGASAEKSVQLAIDHHYGVGGAVQVERLFNRRNS